MSGKKVPAAGYTVTYKNNKNVGTATVAVKGKGDYSGCTGEKTFKITLKKTALRTASSPASSQIKCGWNKDTQADGYQIQYAAGSTFSSGVRKLDVKGGSKQTALIEKLEAGKKYYVRIRSYKKVGSANWYSEWSAAKSVTVKK